MPLVEPGYNEAFRSAATDQPAPFLAHTHDKLCDVLHTANAIGERLANAGFFGPPMSASKAETPMENNVRSNITETVERLTEQLRYIEHQISRLA